MPVTNHARRDVVRHSEDINDIITAVPSWLLRWGTTLFFSMIVLLVALSAFIQYPDIIHGTLKISSQNTAKPAIAKNSGRLTKLLCKNNDRVINGQNLAFLESTADHETVLSLLAYLKQLQQQLTASRNVTEYIFTPDKSIGEMQASYQVFYTNWLSFKAANRGLYLKKRNFLQKELIMATARESQLRDQKVLLQKDIQLAEEEYEMHTELFERKVETVAEYRQQESKLLNKKSPLIQTETAILTTASEVLTKQKELAEIDNQIGEEKEKFIQALNNLLSQAEDWKNKYVIVAAQSGRLSYAGFVQENMLLSSGQEAFFIDPENKEYFGEIAVQQDRMGKIKKGQRVLIKLRSYPFEQYGILTGSISEISNIPYKDSVFISSVNILDRKYSLRGITLKQGMIADAEIITEEASLLQRIGQSIIKVTQQN